MDHCVIRFPNKEFQSFFVDTIISFSVSQFSCLLVAVPDRSQLGLSVYLSEEREYVPLC